MISGKDDAGGELGAGVGHNGSISRRNNAVHIG
jgi:hypothetical protein